MRSCFMMPKGNYADFYQEIRHSRRCRGLVKAQAGRYDELTKWSFVF